MRPPTRKSENQKTSKVTVNASGNGSMTLVTDLYEQVTAAFSAEPSQSNGVTAKIDIGVEKLIVSAERTQDLVTGLFSSSPTTEALGEWMRAAGAASEGDGADVCRHALLKRFRRPIPCSPFSALGKKIPHLNLGYMRLFA